MKLIQVRGRSGSGKSMTLRAMAKAKGVEVGNYHGSFTRLKWLYDQGRSNYLLLDEITTKDAAEVIDWLKHNLGKTNAIVVMSVATSGDFYITGDDKSLVDEVSKFVP